MSRETQRPPLQRMLRIHEALERGKFPNATRLAQDLEVSTKTIIRDLTFMRDQLGLPVAYDRAHFGFFYTEKVSAFPSLQISEGEFCALVIAEKALQQYRGTNLERPLVSAMQKMTQALPDTISVSLGELTRAISFRTRAEPFVDLEVFDALAKAAAARRQLEILYRKPGQAEPEKRVIDPLHLANVNGEWYLFAFDHLRNDVRTFVPTRIKSVKRTGKSFEPPKKFSLDERLKGSFGVHSGDAEYHVVLRFAKEAADYIREKRWHDSQELKELRDGGVELSMRLSSLGEVERWVLSWAGRATVVRPPELAESVRLAAKRLLAPQE